MKKLSNGVTNYEDLIRENRIYVDKTMYIEKMENLPDKAIMFLRPRKFGKTLFTSVLENYYDKNKADEFEFLYKDTYIGKHPTELRNKYSILRFNFSGINTETVETTIKGFKNKTMASINVFAKQYGIDFYINEEREAEDILNDLFKAFYMQKKEDKIYVIIDEYDHFANELLGFYPEHFRNLVSKNGRIRKWYEVLKEGAETVIDRIFITGVAPITLDSLTSGFNISKDISQDIEYNDMMGFTKNELIEVLNSQEITKEEQEKIMPIMKENYDGYKFNLNAKNHIYNSNMCLFFLSDYVRLGEVPSKLVDVNIASDYSKIGKMLDLCKGEQKLEILKNTVEGVPIVADIVQKFNPAIEFNENDMISMLYYLGYLTISGESLGMPELKIPNKVMKEIYADFFMQIMNKEAEFEIDNTRIQEILREIALNGKIDRMVETLKIYLNNLSNRDMIKFDEKYIKLIFYCISMNMKIYWTKSEMEVNRNYPDILLIPRDKNKGYKAIMVEFKYLKKGEKSKLEDKKNEAREQIERYSNFDEIKDLENLNKYIIIVVGNEIITEKVQ